MAPIHEAAENGDVEEVEGLIQEDPEVVHSHGNDFGYTLLHSASVMGHVGMAACLLGHGAHINQSNKNGWTACHLACQEGHPSVLELLLEKGANPAIPDDKGWTPLMWASLRGHAGIVDRLLHHPQAMATLNDRAVVGSTALWYACLNGHGGVARVLLEAGADPTIITTGGLTPTAIARVGGKENCVMLLEEWERRYLLTKARHLHDASHDDDVTQCLAHHHHPSSSSSTSRVVTRGQVKRARIQATPAYLQERVEKNRPLPKVEVAGGGGGVVTVEVNRSVREMDKALLVKVVVEHVVCGGLRGELFVELMELMGRTGDWKKQEEEEQQQQQKGKEGADGGGQEEGGGAAAACGDD